MQVELSDYLNSLTPETVINCGQNHQLYKLNKLIESITTVLNESDFSKGYSLPSTLQIKLNTVHICIVSEIFEKSGFNCEILDTNFKEWRKGKFRAKLVLEFIPDEPEIPEYKSPLDEIRNHPSFSDTQ